MSKGLTRREFVKGTVAGTAVLAFAGSPLFSTWAAEPVKRGGVWRYARNRTTPSLDAHRVSETFTCIGAMYDYLVDVFIDPKTFEFKLVPGLATEWHTEKNDKRLIFTLRKGVLFHDGSKFDAAVAKWNIDRLRLHPKSFLATDLKEIESVDVLNDQTIALNLKYPSAGLIYTLSTARGQAGFVSKSFQEKTRRRRAGPQGLRHRGIPLQELDRRREGRPGAVSRLLEEGGRRQAAALPGRDGGALPAEDRPGGARPPVRRPGHRPFPSAPRGCQDQGEPGPALYRDAPLRVPGRLLRVQPAQRAVHQPGAAPRLLLRDRPGALCQDHRFRRLPPPPVPLHRRRGSPAGRPRTGPITPTTPRRPRSW